MPGTLNVGGHDIITHSGDAGAGDVTVNVQNRLVLDSSGNVGVGTSSPSGKLNVTSGSSGASPWGNADDFVVETNGPTGISILAPDNNQANLILGSPSDNIGSIIRWVHDDGELQVGTHKSNGFLTFKTAIGAERMRIDSSGNLLVGCTTSASKFRVHNGTSTGILSRLGANASTFTAIQFVKESSSDGSDNTGTEVGKITCTSTSTIYSTSSDYRLKENITEITDGITRIKQLNPSRFNFIADPDIIVDGFIAHEVQGIVPEAISGEKDAVNEDGSINPQGIDQSKLVPLLTAALQEAISKIEVLTTRIEALENA